MDSLSNLFYINSGIFFNLIYFNSDNIYQFVIKLIMDNKYK